MISLTFKKYPFVALPRLHRLLNEQSGREGVYQEARPRSQTPGLNCVRASWDEAFEVNFVSVGGGGTSGLHLVRFSIRLNLLTSCSSVFLQPKRGLLRPLERN